MPNRALFHVFQEQEVGTVFSLFFAGCLVAEFPEKVLGLSWALKAVWDMPGAGGCGWGRTFGEGTFWHKAWQCGCGRWSGRRDTPPAAGGLCLTRCCLGGSGRLVDRGRAGLSGPLGFGCAWAGSSFCCENCGERRATWEESSQGPDLTTCPADSARGLDSGPLAAGSVWECVHVCVSVHVSAGELL